MGLQVNEQDEADRDAKGWLRAELVQGGLLVLILVGVSYLFDLVTGRPTFFKKDELFWGVVLVSAYVWLTSEFKELRTRTKQISVRLGSIEERLDCIEQRCGTSKLT